MPVDREPASPPRLTIEIDRDQKAKLEEYIPWGIRRRVFSAIVDDLLVLLHDENDRRVILGGLLTRSIKLDDFLRLDNGEENNG